MNKLYCLIGMFFACGFCSGQNLVPNGDFELGGDSTSIGWLFKLQPNCQGGGPMAGPDFWTVTSPSPDRIIEGQIYCNWDNDTAQSGIAFIVVGGNEAGKTTLLSPLETDSFYRLTCYYNWKHLED